MRRLTPKTGCRCAFSGGVGIAVALSLATKDAEAHPAASSGIDGGVTLANTDVEVLNPNEVVSQSTTGVALGIDVGGYYALSPSHYVGFGLEPAFYQAGPGPASGISFLIGPRYSLRGSNMQLLTSAGFVVAAYEDPCEQGSALGADCPDTRPSFGAGPGFGLSLAPLGRIDLGDGMALLVGPTARYRFASIPYDDVPGGFELHAFQLTAGVHIFLDLIEPDAP